MSPNTPSVLCLLSLQSGSPRLSRVLCVLFLPIWMGHRVTKPQQLLYKPAWNTRSLLQWLAACHSFIALAAFLRWVGSWLCCTHACLSHKSHCRAHSPTQPQGNCKAQDGINRCSWRKACKYIPAYLRKAATAFTASTATSSTGQFIVSIKTSIASIHTPRLVNNLISTGCLWRGNKVSKKNVVRVR